jgi:DNA repair exonuclease SbcCD ATPase subunit
VEKWGNCSYVHDPSIQEIPDDVDKLQQYIDQIDAARLQSAQSRFVFNHSCASCNLNKAQFAAAKVSAAMANAAMGRVAIITSYLGKLVQEALWDLAALANLEKWERYEQLTECRQRHVEELICENMAYEKNQLDELAYYVGHKTLEMYEGLYAGALTREAEEDLSRLVNLANWERYEILAKTYQNKIVKDNAELKTKIYSAEQHNKNISEAAQKYAEIISYKNYLYLNKLKNENANYEAFLLHELEKYISETEATLTRNKGRENYCKATEMLKRWEKNEETCRQINFVENSLKIVRAHLDENLNIQNNLSIYLTNAESAKKSRALLQDKINENAAEYKWMNVYLKCINHKKGLPSLLMQNACAVLNSRINHVLQHITDFTVEFKYEEGFIINTVEPGKKIPADMGSGFQKFILDIIMRIVLTNISPVSNPNLIFIDEGFGCLDKENFLHVAGILQKLKNNFSAMIVITHIPELKAYADKSITVGRQAGDSIMRHGTEMKKNIIDEGLSVDKTKEKKVVKEKKAEKESTCPVECVEDLIEINGTMYRCVACDVVHKYTPEAVKKHLDAKSYKAKHEKHLNLRARFSHT